MLTRRTAIAAISGAAGVSCLAEGNSGTIEIPARLGRNRQILIPAKINGSAEIWCLLDTGGANLLYLRADTCGTGCPSRRCGLSTQFIDAAPPGSEVVIG